MVLRTHRIFGALADEQRINVLLEVLDRGETRPAEIQAALGMSQPAVSRALGQLRAEGLVERGNQRTPFRVPRPREVRSLLRAASLIEHAASENPAALALAERLQRQDMARGAEDTALDARSAGAS